MPTWDAVDVAQQGLQAWLWMALPLLLVALVLGVVVAIVQATTQLHDTALALVPKLLVMAVVLIVLAPWLAERMVDFSRAMLAAPPAYSSSELP
jgi:flagellar biosynthetic protein FliQ